MTIHNPDDATNNGLAAYLQMNDTERARAYAYMTEDTLVCAVRDLLRMTARKCQPFGAPEWTTFVNGYKPRDPDEEVTAYDTRRLSLLHAYTPFMPPVGYMDADIDLGDCPTWVTPDGVLLIDVVTTTALQQLAPLEAVEFATQALSDWALVCKDQAGVRVIVLDDPEASLFIGNCGCFGSLSGTEFGAPRLPGDDL